MTTFRDIDKDGAYMLYICRTFSDKGFQIFLRNFAWYRIHDYDIDDGISLDSNSFCRIDDSYEIYADKKDIIARMEEAVMESLKMGGCSVAAIRKMVQAKWREWLI